MNSYAYKLAETAIELAKIESIGVAKEFLIHEMNRRNFMHWEQLATAGFFKTLLKEYQLVCNKKVSVYLYKA